MSVSTSNSSVMLPLSMLALDSMRVSPCTFLRTSSWGSRISVSTSSGAAPGHTVLTVIVGVWMSGVSWIGRSTTDKAPNSTTRTIPTTTVIGRWMAIQVSPVGRGSLVGKSSGMRAQPSGTIVRG